MAGAMTKAQIRWATATWSMAISLAESQSAWVTLRWVKAWKARGWTSRVAAGVSSVSTRAPAWVKALARLSALYAAMEPETPKATGSPARGSR